MPSARSLLASAALVVIAGPLAAQGRIVDEGTLLITRPGAPSQTESFRIRIDNGTILATGQLNVGTHRVSSALTTDTVGTPLNYTLDVRDNGVQTMSVNALARAGRLTSRSQIPRGDESTREYPVTAGTTLILDDDLLHQTYFLTVVKRSGATQVIKPHTARTTTVTLKAMGLEPITVAGRQVTATHYSLADGGVTREFWIDSAGRLLQIEIPASGLKAVREELPR